MLSIKRVSISEMPLWGDNTYRDSPELGGLLSLFCGVSLGNEAEYSVSVVRSNYSLIILGLARLGGAHQSKKNQAMTLSALSKSD